ncbi:MAG TPA: DUF362 domain-containing protein, partial [Candidatus Eremiobacteraeota bacterium]|nr:DUF362 domain-containing protein [Candidatus Eremiobacteraeota bacterium]
MSDVSIVKCEEYNQEEVDRSLEKLITSLGGIQRFVKEGSKVLLKVNLLFPRAPSSMVTTHPAIVEGVAKLLKKYKCEVFIGDSPAIGSFSGGASAAGFAQVADKIGCKIVDFNKSVRLNNTSGVFKDIEVASEIQDFDAIVNLPKVKTHGQMGLTLGVKNMFGCVVGTKKLYWHLRAGINKDYFAKMLVEIYSGIKPVLTITDGITGMEGNGPQWGRPRKLGVILASSDAVASDLVVAHLVNYAPEKLFTLRAAKEMGIGTARIEDIKFRGEPFSSFDIVDFKKVPLSSLEFKIPSFIFGPLKNTFATRPIVDHLKCTRCKVCIEICPPKVISLRND